MAPRSVEPSSQLVGQSVWCELCHEAGHIASECFRAEMVCTGCRCRGHRKLFCPQRQRALVQRLLRLSQIPWESIPFMGEVVVEEDFVLPEDLGNDAFEEDLCIDRPRYGLRLPKR